MSYRRPCPEPFSKEIKISRPKSSDDIEKTGDDEFLVEKIVDSKVNRHGVTLYKVRWMGFTPEDDTFEPAENLASTGHIDRYTRNERLRYLSRHYPGAALVEYSDGERQLVDMTKETFRAYIEGDGSGRTEDDPDVNDFSLIKEGAKLELLWPYAKIYFGAKVLLWTPLEEDKRSQKKEVVQRPQVKPQGKILLMAKMAAAKSPAQVSDVASLVSTASPATEVRGKSTEKDVKDKPAPSGGESNSKKREDSIALPSVEVKHKARRKIEVRNLHGVHAASREASNFALCEKTSPPPAETSSNPPDIGEMSPSDNSWVAERLLGKGSGLQKVISKDIDEFFLDSDEEDEASELGLGPELGGHGLPLFDDSDDSTEKKTPAMLTSPGIRDNNKPQKKQKRKTKKQLALDYSDVSVLDVDGGGKPRAQPKTKDPSKRQPPVAKRKQHEIKRPKRAVVKEEVFMVESILDCKVDKNGSTVYKVRWKGYDEHHDSWEPTAHVSETGHVDMFHRRQKEQSLIKDTPGVAVIQYTDGEKCIVDLKEEVFRLHMDGVYDSSNNWSVNDFRIICPGAKIELLWKHAGLYFVCKVISWTPLQRKEEKEIKQPKSGEDVANSATPRKDSSKPLGEEEEKQQ